MAGLVISAKKYFTSLAVGSNANKVHLIEASESGAPTSSTFHIDATQDIEFNYSKTVINHSAESKRVYTDGVKINPVKVSISGVIEANRIGDFQGLVNADRWFMISTSKNIEGFVSGVQVQTSPKLYTVTSVRISDDAHYNSVPISIELSEVVLFEYVLEYKYGIKRVEGNTANGVTVIDKSPKAVADPYNTTTHPNNTAEGDVR